MGTTKKLPASKPGKLAKTGKPAKPQTNSGTKTGTKTGTKPATKSAAKPTPAPSAPAKARRARIAFPKKNVRPSDAEFAARLPLAAGKRFEMVRGFLKKQRGVTEELYYYGPKTGWAFRYLRDVQQSVCSIMIHDERLLGVIALDPAAANAVDWAALSPVAQKAKKMAHGSPTLLWVDVALDGSGAVDFKSLLKAKLATLPVLPPPPPPARAGGRGPDR